MREVEGRRRAPERPRTPDRWDEERAYRDDERRRRRKRSYVEELLDF